MASFMQRTIRGYHPNRNPTHADRSVPLTKLVDKKVLALSVEDYLMLLMRQTNKGRRARMKQYAHRILYSGYPDALVYLPTFYLDSVELYSGDLW
jgi:hypothetical protein